MLTAKLDSKSPKVAALESARDAAFESLNERQSDFVTAYARVGQASEAARLAGYSEKNARDTGSRLINDARIAEALGHEVALREATADLPLEGAVELLEKMLHVKHEDLLVLNDQGKPIDIKDWRTLGLAQQKSIKKLSAKVRRSAEGKRAHIVQIDVELVPTLDLLAQLAKLRGWTDDALVNFNMGSGDLHVAAERKVESCLFELLELFDDEALANFFAIDEGDQEQRAEFLKAAVANFKTKLPANFETSTAIEAEIIDLDPPAADSGDPFEMAR